MDQASVVASPARAHLEEEERGGSDNFLVLVRARKCRLARQVRRSRPASACFSFPTLKAECGAYLRVPSHTVLLQTAPAATESRVCVRENCAIHFYGFLGFNRPLCLSYGGI